MQTQAAGYRRVVASTLCPQHSTAPGDFYKHTAPEQGSQFGATFLMQMLLGITKFAIVVLPNDFVPMILLQGLSCTLPGGSLGPKFWIHLGPPDDPGLAGRSALGAMKKATATARGFEDDLSWNDPWR